MKTIHYFALCITLMLSCVSLSAQNLPGITKLSVDKAKIFSRVPSKFSVQSSSMENLFSLAVNSRVVLPLDGTNFLEGTVLEIVQHSELVTTINIMSSNFNGALFTLSRRAIPGQPVTYMGRLVSMKHGDAFVLTMQGNQLTFSKQEQALTVAE